MAAAFLIIFSWLAGTYINARRGFECFCLVTLLAFLTSRVLHVEVLNRVRR
jgi:hypothetical protein